MEILVFSPFVSLYGEQTKCEITENHPRITYKQQKTTLRISKDRFQITLLEN